jgi:hypothetical protein
MINLLIYLYEDMKKGKKPVINPEKLGNNLFILNLRVPVNKVKIAGHYKPDSDGDLLPVEVEYEKDPLCKVFVDSARRKMMVCLSPRAKELLMWLIYETESGQDWIWINRSRYMEECGIKAYNTYRDAVRELHGKSFIQPTTVGGVYFINPHFFFNGSRIAKFPDKVVRK